MLYNRPRDIHQRALDEIAEARLKACDDCEMEWRTQKRSIAFFAFAFAGSIAGAIAMANWWSLVFLYFAFVGALCIYNTMRCRKDDLYHLNNKLEQLDAKRERLIRHYHGVMNTHV
jgi:hypothetical protein